MQPNSGLSPGVMCPSEGKRRQYGLVVNEMSIQSGQVTLTVFIFGLREIRFVVSDYQCENVKCLLYYI